MAANQVAVYPSLPAASVGKDLAALATRIAEAHRQDLAEALAEPSDDELAARTSLMGGRYQYWRELAHDLFRSRRSRLLKEGEE